MDPTAEELTRAAELAPRVAEIANLPYKAGAQSIIVDKWGRYPATILDPRAFQAVVLALPEGVVSEVCWRVEKQNDAPMILLLARLLTPAGMLAFYEALVTSS